jgi:hypothetical protein
MRICITLDDVIRAKTAQIGKIYKKYVNTDIDLEALEFNTTDYADIFGFESLSEYQDFLYNLYSYEIFAEAGTTEKLIDKKFNLWHMKITEDSEYDEPVDVFIANPFEFNNSIGYTCFFLSKIATRIREIYFPMNSSTIWDKCDVLITAEPKLLENKPEGKIAIKIEMPYNKECQSDYTYSKLSEFLDDNNIIEKLIDKE